MLGRPGHPVFTRFALTGAPSEDHDPAPGTAQAGQQSEEMVRPEKTGDRHTRRATARAA
jgi:hypothetical protein